MNAMNRFCWGFSWACWLIVLGSVEASAQYPVASGPPAPALAPPVITTAAGSYITPTQARSLGSRGVNYDLPFGSEARRKARTANRYTVARPVYNGRPGVTFAPYSDYYFPRVLGSKETVYTAAPDAPVPVGYRAFARPGNSVLPR